MQILSSITRFLQVSNIFRTTFFYSCGTELIRHLLDPLQRRCSGSLYQSSKTSKIWKGPISDKLRCLYWGTRYYCLGYWYCLSLRRPFKRGLYLGS